MDTQRPKVGVGLLLIKDGKILLGKRKGSHGEGEYGGFGGHMEGQESFEQTILREMAEEGGPDIKVKNLRFLCVSNIRKYAPKHYVDIGMVAEWESGEPQVTEPEKLEDWRWYDLNDVPQPLFGSVARYLEAYKNGTTYFSD